MKQKDIILIIVIVFISGVLSFFISNALFAKPEDRKTEVEVVELISSEYPPVDQRYFNQDSVDPTQLIQIGNQNNTQPF